jgi:hypothetical protein
MELNSISLKANDLISQFIEAINGVCFPATDMNYRGDIVRSAVELAGIFESALSEYSDSVLVQKLNHSADIAGSLIFWLKKLESGKLIQEHISRSWQNEWKGLINLIAQYRDEVEKRVIPAFSGEWLLAD